MASDLDELERLHAAATPGEWTDYCWSDVVATTHGSVKVDTKDGRQLHICEMVRGPAGDADCRAIAATHNALPGLIAELRALREVAEATSKAIDRQEGLSRTDAELCAVRCIRRAFRTARAKVPK